ncbi:transposase, partial [Mycobacterium tuberculosis T67]
MSGGSSRRYPP